MHYTLIHNGTMIDGTGGPPLKDAAVLIGEDKIRAVGRKADIELPDDELTMLDAGGGTILPGLIDSHVHVMMEGFDIPKLMTMPFSLHFYRAIDHLRRTIEAGVTSVRDAGGADLGVKQALEQGLIVGPRLQISVSGLSITGGHGDGWMPSGSIYEFMPPYPGMPDGLCDGVDQVRRKVREVLRAGAEVVKVCTTGGVLSPTDHPEFTQYSLEELKVMVQEAAYRRGVRVMAHAQGAEGINSIEHGIYLDDEAIELMLEHGTFLVPTLLAPLAVVEIAEAEGTMPEYGIRKAKETIDIHRESIAKAYRAGVTIAMGTDCAVSPHGTNLRELGLMCDIGMSPMESIVATAKTAAECLGWEDRLGTLEVGKLGDIVVAATDPLEDIRSLENVDNVKLVMQGGRVVKDIREA
jgi:imidazolonepropionase-like amidohydrolase